jgi:hypothetical protein
VTFIVGSNFKFKLHESLNLARVVTNANDESNRARIWLPTMEQKEQFENTPGTTTMNIAMTPPGSLQWN